MASDVLERNKALIVELLAEMDRGNIDAVYRLYSPDYVDHSPSAARSMEKGVKGLHRVFSEVHAAFPDTVHTIYDLIAEADRVVARIGARGTHTGPLFGHAATGKQVELISIAIYRIVDGRIAERWTDGAGGLLEALGLGERPA